MKSTGFLGMEDSARRRSRRFDTTEGVDSALKVIELIPRNQDQDAVWHSLEGSLCEHEDVADMKTFGRFQARLPHDLAKAIDPESPFSTPVLEICIAPEADWKTKQHLCRKSQRLRQKSRAIRCRPCVARLIESPPRQLRRHLYREVLARASSPLWLCKQLHCMLAN